MKVLRAVVLGRDPRMMTQPHFHYGGFYQGCRFRNVSNSGWEYEIDGLAVNQFKKSRHRPVKESPC